MFVGEENDWNGMEEESGLKRETLELWRRGGEKGREEMVVDIAATPTPDWKRCNPEIDEKGSFHYASQPTINHNYSTLSPSYHWIGLEPKTEHTVSTKVPSGFDQSMPKP